MSKLEALKKKLPVAKKLEEVDIDLLRDLGKVFEEYGYKGSIERITVVMPPKSLNPMAGINCWQFCFTGPRGEVICTWECWRKGEG
ncbi:MAG: hypothetical protein ACFFA3_18485 [Promethearchaeota archaeon]